MEEKKHISDQYPGLVHFRSDVEVAKPLCNSAQPNPKFSEDGREVTCRSCQKRSKRP
jgi:hypothetical protein